MSALAGQGPKFEVSRDLQRPATLGESSKVCFWIIYISRIPKRDASSCNEDRRFVILLPYVTVHRCGPYKSTPAQLKLQIGCFGVLWSIFWVPVSERPLSMCCSIQQIADFLPYWQLIFTSKDLPILSCKSGSMFSYSCNVTVTTKPLMSMSPRKEDDITVVAAWVQSSVSTGLTCRCFWLKKLDPRKQVENHRKRWKTNKNCFCLSRL